MANDKKLSTNSEVNISKDFQTRVDMKENVLDIVREVLISSTESAFKHIGVNKKTGHAGEYGDGTTYGTGAEENKLNVKIAGKTKSFLQKEIVFGTKSVISIVNIAFNEDTVSFEYKSPESGFFRGVDIHGKTYMVNEKFQLPTGDLNKFKSELQTKLLAFAKKELGYLTSTKIGIDDKTEKSTSSIVESTKQNSNMKKLTIKELFSDDLNEGSYKKEKNTVDLKDTKPAIKGAGDKKLVFDEKDEKENVQKEITTSGPAISNSTGGFKDGALSGAGGYNTNKAWKKTPYGKSKTESRPKVTKDWKVVASESKNKDSNIKVTEKNISKNEGGVSEPNDKPNFDINTGNSSYKNTNQTKAPSSDKDGFWTEIDLIPGTGYVPKGMDQNYIAGMHNASAGDIKKRGYSESQEKSENILNEGKKNISVKNANKHKPDLTRKKFFSLSENKQQGINKRYLITEKTSDEYEKERWKKLSSFKTYESIKEAEEMNEFFESLQENKQPFVNPLTVKKLMNENISHDDMFNDEATKTSNDHINEDTVNVQKPDSKFGLEYKFFKQDFLNENKKYILDLNSKVFVPNPNAK